MIKTHFLVVVVLTLMGLFVLWMMFFKENDKNNTGKKSDKSTKRDTEIKKVESLIKKMEKENPELVNKIRSQFMADARLKSAKGSDPEDVGLVVKYWLSDEGNKKK